MADEPPRTRSADASASVWRRRWPALTLFSAIGVIVVGAAIVWTYTSNLRKYPPDIADPDALAHPLPERPSVIVLPFTAVSGGPRDGLIARRLGDDLMEALVRVPGLFVIARETAVRFRGARFQIKKTAETLGVRYLVTGTLSRRGDSFRVLYRLVDGFTREIDWLGDYKGSLEDLPATRDLAATGILDELDLLESEHRTGGLYGPQARDPEAWLAAAHAVVYRVPDDRGSMRGSLARLREAAAAEGVWPTIPAEIAWSHINAARRGWTESGAGGVASLVDDGLAAAETVMRLDPADPRGPARKADLLALRDGPASVLALRRQAAELGPNDFLMQWEFADALVAAGDPGAALPVMRRALRLHPLHPVDLTLTLAELELAAGESEAALASLSSVVERRPAARTPRLMRIYVLGSLGRPDEARREAGALLRLHPEFRFSRWAAGRGGAGGGGRANWRPILLAAGIPD